MFARQTGKARLATRTVRAVLALPRVHRHGLNDALGDRAAALAASCKLRGADAVFIRGVAALPVPQFTRAFPRTFSLAVRDDQAKRRAGALPAAGGLERPLRSGAASQAHTRTPSGTAMCCTDPPNGMDAPAFYGINCAKVEVSSNYSIQQERPR